ncbi:hypothetical protein [Pseudomonas sp. HLT2-19-2]
MAQLPAQSIDEALGSSCWSDAVVSKVAPAIYLPKYRAMSNAGHGDPVDVSLHGTQLFEGRGVEGRPLVLSIAFGVRQIESDASAGVRLSMFDL